MVSDFTHRTTIFMVGRISMKFGLDGMPLQANPKTYFIIS